MLQSKLTKWNGGVELRLLIKDIRIYFISIFTIFYDYSKERHDLLKTKYLEKLIKDYLNWIFKFLAGKVVGKL